jgi:hypothetical protein
VLDNLVFLCYNATPSRAIIEIALPNQQRNTNMTIQINGVKYHPHSALSCGDYSDNGMVGISNVAIMLENHAEKVLDVWNDIDHTEDYDTEEIEITLIRGIYSSRTIFIREDLFEDYAQRLNHYILLDEDDHSMREYEQSCEDWENYGAKEFLDALKKKALEIYEDPDLEVYLDEVYEPSNEVLWKLYCENSNYGSVYEGSSTYFYTEEAIKEIASMDFFRDLLIQAKQHAKARKGQAQEMEAVLFE